MVRRVHRLGLLRSVKVTGVSERDQWMGCMVRAMQEVGLEAGLRTELEQALFKTADFMRNQPE